MPIFNQNPLNYPINTLDTIRRFRYQRAPTNADYKQFVVGDHWLDDSSNDWWILCFRNNVQGIWRKMAGTSAAIEFITPDTGGQTQPDALNNLNFLGDSAGYLNGIHFFGTPLANTISARDLRNVTKYVVDPIALETEYTTIQSALDAANTAGGNATIYVRPGVYFEDLTLYTTIDIIGAVATPANFTTIIAGSHTPPATGSLSIRNLSLIGTNTIFNSAAAGDTTIAVVDCLLGTQDGFTFNLPNWVGTIVAINCFWQGVEDGIINNATGTSPFLCSLCRIGNGPTRTGTINNDCFFENCTINAHLNIGGQAIATIFGTNISQMLTTSVNSIPYITDCYLESTGEAIINHTSAGILYLNHSTVDTANVPAIDGTGIIELGEVTFLQNANLAGAMTLQASQYTRSGPQNVLSADATDATKDAWTKYEIQGISGYSWGIDHSDADIMKLTDGVDPSNGNQMWRMTVAGQRTLPLQPRFRVRLNADIDDVTGDSTQYTILFDQVAYDIGNNYNPATGQYTVPVTGFYLFNATVAVHDLAAGNTNFVINTRTTDNVETIALNPSTVRRVGYPEDLIMSVACLSYMTAGDVATVDVRVDGGAKIIDINASQTDFTGCLLF